MELGEEVALAQGLRIHQGKSQGKEHDKVLAHSQEAERGEALPLRLILLIYSSWDSSHGMALHIIRVGLPTSTQPTDSLTSIHVS